MQQLQYLQIMHIKSNQHLVLYLHYFSFLQQKSLVNKIVSHNPEESKKVTSSDIVCPATTSPPRVLKNSILAISPTFICFLLPKFDLVILYTSLRIARVLSSTLSKLLSFSLTISIIEIVKEILVNPFSKFFELLNTFKKGYLAPSLQNLWKSPQPKSCKCGLLASCKAL